mmetsp:Transcript_4647/g.10508  ORF Transcript_4647/g.10508 Transcript_4647/m.10508 type:complete len:275 (+) Transcript_4647:352-1176(+)
MGDRLQVLRALLRRILHQALVICLRILLPSLGLGHLLVKVLDEEVNHRNHAGALISLLRIRAEGFRRRGRGFLALRMGEDLREDRDARVRDSAGRGRWGCSAAKVDNDAVLPCKLTLGWGLVQRRVVELVEAVLGERQKLLGSGIRGHQVGEGLVLLLALLGGLSHGLVQRRHSGFQRSDLLLQGSDALSGRRDRRFLVRNSALEALLLVIGVIELHRAVLLLVVVICLLLFQGCGHVVDHGDDLLEAHLPAAKRERDEVEAGAPRAGAPAQCH